MYVIRRKRLSLVITETILYEGINQSFSGCKLGTVLFVRVLMQHYNLVMKAIVYQVLNTSII